MKKLFVLLGLVAILAMGFLVFTRMTQAGELSDFGYVEIGYAEAYDSADAGLPTASGEGYSPARLTAAHAFLPMGTEVRVTSPDTNKTVVVRVNDRGVFKAETVVRLSGRAGRELGVEDWSRPVPVVVEAVAGGEVRGRFYVQVGAFELRANADGLVRTLRDKGFQDFRIIETIRGDERMYKVQVGRFLVLSGAREALKRVREVNTGAFIVSDTIESGMGN